MQFSTKVSRPDKISTELVVVGVFESRKLTAAASVLDKASGGAIEALAKRGDMDGKSGSIRLLYGLRGVAAARVLVIGLGAEKDFGVKQFRDAVRAAVVHAADTGAKKVSLYADEWPVATKASAWKARQAAILATDAAYRFDAMKSKKSAPRNLATVEYAMAAAARDSNAERGTVEGRAIGAGMSLARDLGNLPGNVCTPAYLADQAKKLGRECKLEVKVLEQRDIERLGMGSFLAVARGSRQPPKFIILNYRGGPKTGKPVCLVGKGITFDTGGISLKPSAEMDEMKWDMSGAGSVLGTLRAIAEMKLKINVIGVIPACENMPDGNAIKPGDIVTSMSGQTIEILNTDAEGRLILCDALTYVERFKPQAVIDIATLTGACIVALGHVASGLFSNRDALANELSAAGMDAWDRAWHLPLWDDYHDQLKSPFADVANIGGRAAGSVTAACFLSRFAKNFDWAHLDIAGTAWRSGANKGATGRPVPLLTAFLMARAGK
jgi:leucyl aminopeptidase